MSETHPPTRPQTDAQVSEHHYDLLAPVGSILLRCSDVFHGFTVEYPGYIALRTDDGGLWAIGTANPTWGADLYIAEESYINGESPDHSVTTDVPADEPDAHRIADALFRAMSHVG